MWLDYHFTPFTLHGDMKVHFNGYQETLKTKPSDHGALSNLFVLSCAEKNLENTYKYGNLLLENCLENLAEFEIAGVYSGFAKVEMGLKNFEKAIEWYKITIERNEPYGMEEAYWYMAACYAYLKDYESAITNLLKAIECYKESYDENSSTKHPDTCEYWENIGQMYGILERYEEALPYLKERLQDDPDNWFLYYGLGVCYERKGDDLLALNYYYKALDIDPTQAAIYNNLGSVANNLHGKIPEAIAFAEKALEVVEDDNELRAIICSNLAKLHKRLSNDDEAQYYQFEFLKSTLGIDMDLTGGDEDDDDYEDDEDY